MMLTTKKLNLLGLAQRASGLVTGDEIVEQAVKRNKVFLLLVASDASERTLEKYRGHSERYNVPLNTEFTKYELSHAIGRSRTVIGMANAGFAQKFLSYAVESEESYD